jgi:hypothetical protein
MQRTAVVVDGKNAEVRVDLPTRLESESEVGVSDGVALAVHCAERDAEDVWVLTRQLGNVVGHLRTSTSSIRDCATRWDAHTHRPPADLLHLMEYGLDVGAEVLKVRDDELSPNGP